MADITNIASSGSGSLLDFLTEKQQGSSILDSSSTAASAEKYLTDASNAKRAQSAYGAGITSSIGQAALKRALAEMGASNGKVTFDDIAKYQKELESTFSATTRVELAKLGVSPSTEFTLNISPEGKISVACDDQVAKEKIEKYLSDNPKVCEQFGYIQALANLDRAKQSPVGTAAGWQALKNTKMTLQAQAVEMFFGAAMDAGMNFSSTLASFGEDSETASYYTGVDYTV